MLFTCQGCGYKTLEEDTKSSYDICKLCGWEDDYVQNKDSDYEGGANHESRREHYADFVKEYPELPNELIGYVKDKDWELA